MLEQVVTATPGMGDNSRFEHLCQQSLVAGDFTLASAAPLHAMLQEGIVDKNIKFTPVLDNLRMPDYIDWELRPFTNHTVRYTAEYGQHIAYHV